jgi:hypothetical protein
VDYQRKHPRFPIDTPASVSILGGDEGAIATRVADVSEAGLRLISPVTVAIGETLRVEIAEEVFVGIVRNSEDINGTETLVGLELIHCIELGKLQGLLDEWTVRAF